MLNEDVGELKFRGYNRVENEKLHNVDMLCVVWKFLLDECRCWRGGGVINTKISLGKYELFVRIAMQDDDFE